MLVVGHHRVVIVLVLLDLNSCLLNIKTHNSPTFFSKKKVLWIGGKMSVKLLLVLYEVSIP
jgi:hypothetical protein